MNITLGVPNRPFTAIKNGTKKVEGRVPTSLPNKYEALKAGEIIILLNEDTGEKINLTIKFVHHYEDVKTMLKTEGLENVLSSEPKTIEHGIESYNSFLGYKENILIHGIYAIGVEPIK